MLQKEAFLAGEGDAWQRRNETLQPSASQLRQIASLAPFIDQGSRVLEIGCSTGHNSHLLQQHIGTGEFYGIDPSGNAIEKGRIVYPELSLSVGTADCLPYEDAFFDVVWFAFCLYLVDRPLLHRVVAEGDRVLSSGGILAITDFDPPHPTKRPYRHREGVFSYKLDYSRLFLADPAYVFAEKIPLGLSSANFAINGADRVALSVLRKEAEANYVLETD